MGGPQEIGEIRSIRQEFLGICHDPGRNGRDDAVDRSDRRRQGGHVRARRRRSEEHTSELQSLMRISYAVFCLKKKKKTNRYVHLITKPSLTDKYKYNQIRKKNIH